MVDGAEDSNHVQQAKWQRVAYATFQYCRSNTCDDRDSLPKQTFLRKISVARLQNVSTKYEFYTADELYN